MLLICAVSVNAQNKICQFLANKILDKVNGVITESHTTDNDSTSYIIFADLPSFYDSDLFLSELKDVTSQYSDVKIDDPWETSVNGWVKSGYIVSGSYMVIAYKIAPDKNQVMFVFSKK